MRIEKMTSILVFLVKYLCLFRTVRKQGSQEGVGLVEVRDILITFFIVTTGVIRGRLWVFIRTTAERVLS